MSHYYSSDGRPVYELPCSTKEGMRGVTVRDARKLRLSPGVTTVLSVLDKPGLLRYFHQRVVEAVFNEYWQKEGESFESYVDRLIHVSKDQSKKASSRGSELHDYLEKCIKAELPLQDVPEEVLAFINPVLGKLMELGFTPLNSIAEKSFSHSLGFGGKVDLHSPSLNIVLDFKTKDSDDINKFIAYDEHLMQLAAYRDGLNLCNARCFDVYFSSKIPGLIKVHEWKEEELQEGYTRFLHLLGYWQSLNKITL